MVNAVVLAVVGWLLISYSEQYQYVSPDSNTYTHTALLTPVNKVPHFNLQDYNGKMVSLADFIGKPLVIHFWVTWCSFCRKELMDFAAIQEEFGHDVVIIVIDRAESREMAKKYTDALGITDDLLFLLDPLDALYPSIGGFSMPETIFVDRNGNIVDHKRGLMEKDEMRQKMQKLLLLQ